jgi:hypothetical protein
MSLTAVAPPPTPPTLSKEKNKESDLMTPAELLHFSTEEGKKELERMLTVCSTLTRIRKTRQHKAWQKDYMEDMDPRSKKRKIAAYNREYKAENKCLMSRQVPPRIRYQLTPCERRSLPQVDPLAEDPTDSLLQIFEMERNILTDSYTTAITKFKKDMLMADSALPYGDKRRFFTRIKVLPDDVDEGQSNQLTALEECLVMNSWYASEDKSYTVARLEFMYKKELDRVAKKQKKDEQ